MGLPVNEDMMNIVTGSRDVLGAVCWVSVSFLVMIM